MLPKIASILIGLSAILALLSIVTATRPLHRRSKPIDGSAPCTSNAECMRRGLPLLKPLRLGRRDAPAPGPSAGPITTLTYTGNLQQFQATAGAGYYSIYARGAAGGASTKYRGGFGAEASAQVYLNANEIITVVVGGMGATGVVNNNDGGGGGGTFVYTVSTNPRSNIVSAGGGGGGGTLSQGVDGRTGPDGSASATGIQGGTGGLGGNAGASSGAGAGFFQNGAGGTDSVNGRTGPEWTGGTANRAGGYGGGGSSGSTVTGGGGGGYSGGAGANSQQGGGAGGTLIADTYNSMSVKMPITGVTTSADNGLVQIFKV